MGWLYTDPEEPESSWFGNNQELVLVSVGMVGGMSIVGAGLAIRSKGKFSAPARVGPPGKGPSMGDDAHEASASHGAAHGQRGLRVGRVSWGKSKSKSSPLAKREKAIQKQHRRYEALPEADLSLPGPDAGAWSCRMCGRVGPGVGCAWCRMAHGAPSQPGVSCGVHPDSDLMLFQDPLLAAPAASAAQPRRKDQGRRATSKPKNKPKNKPKPIAKTHSQQRFDFNEE